MKVINQFFISSLVIFAGCNQKDKTSETHNIKTEVKQKTVTFADFKKIQGVDNVQEVPFQLFTKLDSVQFFTAPSKDAAHLNYLTINSIIIMDLKSLKTSILFTTALIITFQTV